MNLTPVFFDHVALSTKTIGWIVLIGSLPVSWLYIRRRDARDRARAIAHLAKSPALEPAAFATTYFPADQAAIARRLRELLIPHLPFDLARLHPDDRLFEDLRMDALDSMSTVDYRLSVEKEFSVKITDVEVANMRTLRDLTACVARLVAARGIISPDHGSSPR
jgi:acyl carrier protein